jgi:hypothetical protein
MANGSVIDGGQMDKILQDMGERFNELKPEDIRTGMTANTINFSLEPRAGRQYIKRVDAADALEFHPQNTYPWVPIRNNEATTRSLEPTAPDEDQDYGPNSWRVTGTYLDRLLSTDHPQVESGENVTSGSSTTEPLRDQTLWLNRWRTGSTGANTLAATEGAATIAPAGDPIIPKLGGNWHWAYSHCWAFQEPAVLDHLTIYFRTEWLEAAYSGTAWRNWPDAGGPAHTPGINWFAYEGYDAPFAAVPSHLGTPLAGTPFVDDFIIQFSIYDMHSNWERLRDVVALHVSKLGVSQWRFSENALGNHTGVGGKAFYDISPELPDNPTYAAPTTPPASHTKGQRAGMEVRLPELKIPIPAASQVRLAVVVPWYTPRGSNDLSPAELRGWAMGESTPFCDWALHGSAVFLEGLLPDG